MSAECDELVQAALGHLHDLKARGARFVSLSPESLTFLGEFDRRSTKGGNVPSTARLAGFPAVAATPLPVVQPASAELTHQTLPTASAPSVGAPATAQAAAAPSSAGDKLEAMRELRERAIVCMKCSNLAAARTQVVFGVGTVEADLMFVGEAPGADEDRQGEPFVGAAGQLLTRIIQTMGLSRESVYIANILKCRPDTPGQTSGNRKPTADEMKTCIPYLHSQIDIIQPKVLVALGATAVEGLLGNIGGITKVRGRWREYRGIPLMPTFHPAYLLRNMALSEKRKVWEDMLQVMDRLGLSINEKQRGFFLPKS